MSEEFLLKISPSQSCVMGFCLWPFLHSHLYEPTEFTQVPPPHTPGIAIHSFTSTIKTKLLLWTMILKLLMTVHIQTPDVGLLHTLTGLGLKVWNESASAWEGPDRTLLTGVTPGFSHSRTTQILGTNQPSQLTPTHAVRELGKAWPNSIVWNQ